MAILTLVTLLLLTRISKREHGTGPKSLLLLWVRLLYRLGTSPINVFHNMSIPNKPFFHKAIFTIITLIQVRTILTNAIKNQFWHKKDSNQGGMLQEHKKIKNLFSTYYIPQPQSIFPNWFRINGPQKYVVCSMISRTSKMEGKTLHLFLDYIEFLSLL